ncbi:DUF5462 family protein (plasmid) [Escherichia coli]|nr:DUF5462 family protein [Escherichia coli]QXC28367.1 DUF5462 family protein [Escherichia coli]
MAYITVKQALPDNEEARITLKTALMVDGKKVALNARLQCEEIALAVVASAAVSGFAMAWNLGASGGGDYEHGRIVVSCRRKTSVGGESWS